MALPWFFFCHGADRSHLRYFFFAYFSRYDQTLAHIPPWWPKPFHLHCFQSKRAEKDLEAYKLCRSLLLVWGSTAVVGCEDEYIFSLFFSFSLVLFSPPPFPFKAVIFLLLRCCC